MQNIRSVGGDNHGARTQAARWFARVRSPECTAQERQAFDAWLAADESHRRAYDAVARAAAGVSDALKADPRLRAMLEESPEGVAASAAQRRFKRVGLAAAWIAAIGVAALLSLAPRFGGERAASSLQTYVNVESRRESITLEDGSVLHLDAGARVAVEMLREQRRLTLLAGRAYFEVAKNPLRPFSVEAAGTRTVALGTKFEVKLQGTGVVVTLAEGSVSVAPTTDSADWKQVLEPGDQFMVDAGQGRGEKRHVKADEVTAWSSGRLYFDGAPLSQVLAEINRYSSIKVELGDEALASIPIGGNFVAGGDAGAFVQALSAILPVRSEPSGDDAIVLYSRERTVISR
ncbi:MAG: FecR domain-containing protein [Steroidobacteraceae bacterium]